MAAIKDSGNRTALGNTGFVRDVQEGKGRMDLLPWYAIMDLSKHCEAGAAKYGERNIDKGAPLRSLLSSGGRHLAKYIQGEDDEDHLVAACWNLMWALQQRTTHPELNDMPWSEYYVPVGPKKDEQEKGGAERPIPDNLTNNAKMALNSLYRSAKKGAE